MKRQFRNDLQLSGCNTQDTQMTLTQPKPRGECTHGQATESLTKEALKHLTLEARYEIGVLINIMGERKYMLQNKRYRDDNRTPHRQRCGKKIMG